VSGIGRVAMRFALRTTAPAAGQHASASAPSVPRAADILFATDPSCGCALGRNTSNMMPSTKPRNHDRCSGGVPLR
jgi:hypothetical protein